MFTVVAWSASVDQAALAAIAAVADPHVRINGNDVIVPTEIANLVGAYANGVNITRAQLVSPSLRRLLNPEIAPVDISALPTTPFRFWDLRDDMIKLDGEEALDAFTSENGAGATRMNVLAWLADKKIEPVSGDVRTVRVSATTTLVAFVWTNGAIPGYEWRPGGIGVTVDSGAEGNIFRQGNFGVWGEFAHNTPPTIDFLSATADTSETGELDLIKLA